MIAEPSAQVGAIPFPEQIAFFREKIDLPTNTWADLYATEHEYCFGVAGAAEETLLSDLRGAVNAAIADNETLGEFRKRFGEIIERTGWDYRGGFDWRTRVIYETNLRQSYFAGREKQMSDPELRRARPFGLYKHGGSRNPRAEHLAWHNLVLPLDDPWWLSHSPMNGWGCHCKKFCVSERDVKRMGLSIARQSPKTVMVEKLVGPIGDQKIVSVPEGIDPGFEYMPGEARLRAQGLL
uniref:Phage Mu protein F like protein n=1 Tax=Candidatus Kentrum sp. UNK TaxID=2126344 RepID=A0A450ZWN4_9GAMM|nr:MAG: Phage Mu protein F like protein [Candidatus Kentron sp. UNK]VFK68315.1 MAG: Phage Mu protein F like protein [Candidatus Kentron sp. UNK]